MNAFAPLLPILIIGSGPGGLTLAQALRKRKIPFRVFERDANVDARGQGWALALHWIIPDLLRNFSSDLPPIDSISHLYDRGETSEGAIFQGLTGVETSRFSSADGKGFIRAARPKLREWLATHLNIEWGKKLIRYDTDDSGVTAHFEDGTSAPGCMLVGADGSRSVVRSLLLGTDAAKTHVYPMDVYVGMAQLSRQQYEYQFKNFARSFYVVEAPTAHLFTGLISVSPDGETADYYWMVFRHLTEEELTIKDRTIDAWTNQEILDAALKTISVLNPRFNQVVWLTKPDGIHRPALYMEDFAPPTQGFGGQLVTLLGDAAHKMSPFKGEGANHAMKDAIDMIELISGIEDVPSLIRAYEKVILARTIMAVTQTRAAAMDWVNHSVRSEWQDKLAQV